MMVFAVTILLGYLFGCFQTSYIISKLIKKQDIRSLGNGNAGASNTTVVFGWKYGILVALGDIFKATISLVIIRLIFRSSFSHQSLYFLLYLNTLFVIIGHNHPFYMKFKGGKGTASLIGALLAIDLKIAAIGIIAIVLVSLISNYIALGTLALVTSFVISTCLFGYSTGCVLIALLLAAMSIVRHLVNYKNILNGTEHKIRKFL